MENANTGLPTGALIAIIAGAVIILAVLVLLIVILTKKKRKPVVKINDEFIESLITALGGKENISAVSTENGGRVAITVVDTEKLDTEGIKKLAVSGVFITGNTVKTLYREDSQNVKNAIEKRI